MSLLLDVQSKIHKVDALIADLQRTARTAPRPSVLANIRALEKEQRFLLQEFEHFAAFQEEDVYRYRLLNADRPLIVGIADSWKSFQELFSATFVSLKQGLSVESSPKGKGKKAKKDAENVLVTPSPQFGFGYAYSGSVGVGLTLPLKASSELFNDPIIEQAAETIFSLAMTRGEDLTASARRVGPATVAAMHKWADTLARNDFGVGVEWRRDLVGRGSITLPLPEVIALRDSLAKTTIESESTLTGELKSVDVDSKEFRMTGDDKEVYKGHYEHAITREQSATLPARYSARIKKITKAVLAEGEEDTPMYVLVSLSKL